MSTLEKVRRLTDPKVPRLVPSSTRIDPQAVGMALLRLSRCEGFCRVPGTPNIARHFTEGYAVFGPSGALLSFTPNREIWI